METILFDTGSDGGKASGRRTPVESGQAVPSGDFSAAGREPGDGQRLGEDPRSQRSERSSKEEGRRQPIEVEHGPKAKGETDVGSGSPGVRISHRPVDVGTGAPIDPREIGCHLSSQLPQSPVTQAGFQPAKALAPSDRTGKGMGRGLA